MKRRTNFKNGVAVLVLGLVSALFAKDPAVLSLHGEVMDSQCGFNVHSMDRSHDAMIKKGIYGNDARTCTLHCVKEAGGSFVLVVKDRVYRLDDQTLPEQFSGKKVKVTGTLDEKTQTVHVFKIDEDVNLAAEKAPAKP